MLGKDRAHKIILIVLLAVLAVELLRLATDWPLAILAARIGICLLCVVAVPFVTIREAALLGFALLLTLAVWIATGGLAPLASALDLAAFFGAFIAAITLMREVAARSRSILAVGRYLTGQPPGRRFYATAIGGHLLGIFLNFGAISLMAPLIQKSALTDTGAPDRDLERRQLSALIRGFAWILLWAPTTLAQAVLLTIFTEVAWRDIALLGIGTTIGFIIVGRLYDRLEWPQARLTQPGPPIRLTAPTRAILVVCGVCAILIGATFGGSVLSGVSIAQALVFVAPAVTVGWFVLQVPPHSLGQGVARVAALGPVLVAAAPSLARSAIALGVSGYIGRLAGQALPIERISDAIDLAAVPGWLFLAALPVLITLGGQIALSPILMVIFLGEVLRSVDTLPTGQMQIVFALSVGWSLSMTASPNATATLLISASSGIPPTTLTWAWNLRYGLICYALCVLIFAIIA